MEYEFFKAGFCFGVIWLIFLFVFFNDLWITWKLKKLEKFLYEHNLEHHFYLWKKGIFIPNMAKDSKELRKR